jgi:hypothetical protein
MTREEWLGRMVDAMRPMFTGAKVTDKVRVTCGWPSRSGLGRRKRRIGECWPVDASADKTVEIFISPYLGTALEAAETLAHELVHATGAMSHQGDFVKIAKTIGLEKPWKSTHAGPALVERLNALIKEVGEYPHARLDSTKIGRKTQTTRLLKVKCPGCGYTIRTTARWIEQGLPTCPCGEEMEAV